MAKNKYIKVAKDTMKLGIMTGVGSYAVGAIGGNSGIANTVSGGLNMLNIGQLAKNGMMVAGVGGGKSKKGKHNKVVKNILG